jgi:benzaldehyde dehydrogenase (NAD)
MINAIQHERARRLLEDAVSAGARVVTRGRAEPPFFSPTVVVDVTPEMPLWREEIFAPIAPVLVVDDDEQAVAIANDSEYGLVCSVLSASNDRGLRVARRLRAGMVHVNDATPQDEALAPFGGFGSSGLGGRSGGDSNLTEFTELRWLTVAPGPVHYPY